MPGKSFVYYDLLQIFMILEWRKCYEDNYVRCSRSRKRYTGKEDSSVTNGPPSSGQHLRIGISSRFGFSVSTTSWHGACLTYFGKLIARLIIGIIVTTLILFCRETYGSFIISRSSSATSSSFSTPRAMACLLYTSPSPRDS